VPVPPPAEDLHEWLSFDDPEEDRTWVFDLTFLTSEWTCIFGRGCPGVLTGPAPELEEGCCSYGAHFTDEDDARHVRAMADRLTDSQWQLAKVARRRGGPTCSNQAGETVTRMVDGACIFLNRRGFPGGAGCALHRAALEIGERPLDWKPEVCWQLPLRRVDETDDYGHVTSTLREWKRRDWGAGGFEFHWWCTEDHAAFVGERPVFRALRDEIVAMVGETPYQMLVAHLDGRTGTLLPHPALRRR
jgi:hypothetical protein